MNKMYIVRNLLAMVCLLMGMTSCLKSDLEELDLYEGADITAVSRVEYRYISDEVSPASGQQIVKNVTLGYKNSVIDREAATVTIPVTVPANFPEAELQNLSASQLVVVITLSTAARIKPLDDAPALGVPGDWSKPNKYRVTAANGTEKDWTITLNLQK